MVPPKNAVQASFLAVGANKLTVVWSDMHNNPYVDAELPSADPYQVQTHSDIIVSELTTPGNQGKKCRMDLRTVLENEHSHLLGREHEPDGLRAQTLSAGMRRVPSSGSDRVDVAVLEQVFADGEI
jgi:hypothetical protein